jgi:hypothetical protein
MEQFVRDARIAQIYEGTNGVQAMDLIGRKVPEGTGRLVRRFLGQVHADLKDAQGDPRLQELATPVADALRRLQEATMAVMNRAMRDPNEAGAAAADYLRMFGLVSTGWMWLRMARVAHARLDAGAADPIYDAKVKTARFYVQKLLPQVEWLGTAIGAGAGSLMELDTAAF